MQLIEMLGDAGLPVIESTSFVSPKWVPQLADAAELLRRVRQRPGVRYPVLAPNMKVSCCCCCGAAACALGCGPGRGREACSHRLWRAPGYYSLQGFENALKAGAKEVAIFTAASEAFNQRNLNCSVDESLHKFEGIMAAARAEGVAVRGYVSCVVGCPIQGAVEPAAAARVAGTLHEMGCYEVSMGDTVGVGTPASVAAMFEACKAVVPVQRLAAHMHDTYGQALANILAALQAGVAVVDTSVAGLGGCPYAKGATGACCLPRGSVVAWGGHGSGDGRLLRLAERGRHQFSTAPAD